MIANDREFKHYLMIRITKAYRIRPYEVGIDPGCACHSAPFPAARDYRRRTKRRRRRQR